MGRTSRTEKLLAGAAALALTFAAAEGAAKADGSVSPKGKGTVGGALLGIEVVDITMGAVGVRSGWPYFVFGGLGGVGGAIGGYFVDTKASVAEPSLYMLAGGMALVIPTLVISLNATAYRPPDTDTKEPVQNQPVPSMGTTQTRRTTHSRSKVASREYAPHIPLSTFDLYQGKLALGVPAVGIKPLYTHEEIAKYGVTQGTEVHVPLFSAAF